MNKDVIYIDVDDDITAIIGKIKASKEKIVALVPPKRMGALQSAVNLRLLDRMAKAEKKHLVLITNNQALMALSAAAKIPVAKNLQSKPELAEIPALAVDDGDDIIDGSQLPVGELEKTGPRRAGADDEVSDAIETIDIDDETIVTAPAVGTTVSFKAGGKASAGAPGAKKSRIAIPNFDSFRKRLFLIIAGVVVLIGLLIWAFGFAPSAKVIITARTTPVPMTSSVTLGGTAATDSSKGLITSLSQELKKEVTLDFAATGQKDLGERATGTVRFSTNSISALGTTIPAGTKLTASSGVTFTTDAAVTITIDNYTGTNVGVTATAAGTNYNGATGSVSGAPSGISASLTAATAGGTSRPTKVVSAADIERAKGDLIGKAADEEKAELIKKFTNKEVIIDSSFTVARAEAISLPALDAEAADSKAKLTIATTYTIQAISYSELESYLKEALEKKVNTTSQRIYETGIDDVQIGSYKKDGDNPATATIVATGQIGPKIDEAAVKEQVKGKIYGDVQRTLEAIDGVEAVDVQFSFFWVRTVPNNTSKITIEFQIQDGQ